MDEKKVQKFRQRLLEEYQKLIRSINRNRLAEEEIKLENTEDEGDLATISHNKELLYNLHESDFQRLKSIQEALKRMDRGEYGECLKCGEDINEKRLMAVPWATMCIECQEDAEREEEPQSDGHSDAVSGRRREGFACSSAANKSGPTVSGSGRPWVHWEPPASPLRWR